ncbi:MAG: hypothetical protein C0594_08495 [Marinilabiliales bacterium]|nr:MAG: hypothetical protein C0594_08495 [Marinilabiliales bacterium]
MRQIIFSFIIILNCLIAFGQKDTIKASSKIKDVTVFFDGAQITRKVQAHLIKGKCVIEISGLPKYMKHESIQVGKLKNGTILSVKTKNHFIREDEVHKQYEKEIKKKTIQLKKIKSKIEVYKQEENLLYHNREFHSKETGSSIAELKQAADYFRLKLNEINDAKIDLQLQINDITEEIEDIYKAINKNKATKQFESKKLLITVESNAIQDAKFTVKYFVESAGWTPLYDFRVEKISDPLKIVYNADVYQSTGEDWENVKLTLSTSNPSLSLTKPELEKWYIDQKKPKKSSYRVEEDFSTNYSNAGTLKGSVREQETNEAMPFANIVIEKNGEIISGGMTDFDGNYNIKPVPAGIYTVKCNYVGYSDKQYDGVTISANKITFLDFSLSGGVALQEVMVYAKPLIDADEVTSGGSISLNNHIASTVSGEYSKNISSIRGSRSEGSAYYIDGVKVSDNTSYKVENLISNSTEKQATNLEYKIDIPYTIYSTGENNTIKIKEVTANCEYNYQSVPKYEDAAFLVVLLKDWEKLNLLSARTNIYNSGTFIGHSSLNANQAKDTLILSLGRENSIVIDRKPDTEIKATSFIGPNVKETIGIIITVRNNKDEKINIQIDDQYPVAISKDVDINLIESSDAKVNKEEGKLTWELELEPGQNKELKFSYSVKYPSHMRLNTQ